MFPIFAGNSASTGYNLTRSLRTRASASGYLSRTYSTSQTNNKIQTFSCWVKRGKLGVQQEIYSRYDGSSTAAYIALFTSSDTLSVNFGGAATYTTTTTQVFRDTSAWYHFVFYVDTTQATAANRFIIYVNGVQVTALSAANYPPQNAVAQFGVSSLNTIGAIFNGSADYFDGYLTEVNFIDGQALTPSSFGSTNALTGVWQPARYTGTYGTNGFYLPFTDNSALTTSSNVGLGKDFSGNANYWVTNNISITAGVTYDSMTDVPTLTSATAANFAVLNPLSSSTNLTFSNANLATTYAAGTWNVSRASIGITSGSWYWEVTAGGANNNFIGIANSAAAVTDALGVNSNSAGWNFGGAFYYNGTSVGNGTTWTTGDVIGVAFNATANTITFYKNNVIVNVTPYATAVTGGLYFPANSQSAGTFNVNFGQRPFSYTPPTGFVALNTYNLPDSTIVKGNTVMDAILYTGDGTTSKAVTGLSFQPDLTYVKNRSAASDPTFSDTLRGITKVLYTDSTSAESTAPSFGYINSILSTGFNVNSGGGVEANFNKNGQNYVGWTWKAGQGSSSSNTNGTITSTVSVNASAGFSVVTYTGTGANATVGHGLGVAPAMMIFKDRSVASTWLVYHQNMAASPAQGYLTLNGTNAYAALSNIFNNTAPTSSVISIGTNASINTSSNTYVAYCWTPIAGYSAFGSYTGNGSTDGPFVYTGFRPRWVMFKRTDSTSSWTIWDTAMNTYNVVGTGLYADLSNAESTGNSAFDYLSNGFKVRNSFANINSSSGTYIYMAFAENPFKNALAR